MNCRKEPLINGNYYHVYNRTINNVIMFPADRDYKHALLALWFYQHRHSISLSTYLDLTSEVQQMYLEKFHQDQQLAEVVCFSLMPNHFHLVLKQTVEGGISKYLSDFQNCLTRYFNNKYNHQGQLLNRPYQAKLIENEYYFLHVCRYVIINPAIAYIVNTDHLINYPYTSFPEHLGLSTFPHTIASSTLLTSQFKNTEDFTSFIMDHADYKRHASELGKHTLE